jgi:hypothetical protein
MPPSAGDRPLATGRARRGAGRRGHWFRRPLSLVLAVTLALAGLIVPTVEPPSASAQASCSTPSNPPTICIQDASATEGQRVLFTITLSQAANQTVEVFYSMASGTATAGQDFTPRVDSFTFPAGTTSIQLHADTIDDALAEGNETFTVTITSNVPVGRGTATGTIIDNDGAPPPPAITVSIDDDSRLEGNNSTGAFLVFFVNLSRAPQAGEVVNVDYQTQDGTAKVTQDYRGAIGTLTFDGNQPNPRSQQAIQVEIIGDRIPESPKDETLFVNLTAVRGPATISDGQGVGTITDDDSLPTAKINRGGRVLEGNSGRRTEVFTVTLSDSNGRETNSPFDGLTIQFQTANGTAVGGAACPNNPGNSSVDYISTNGTLTFRQDEYKKAFGVDVCGDTVNEQDKTFNVIISSNSATIGRGQAAVTIVNDDRTIQPTTPPANKGTLGANGVTVKTTAKLQAPAEGSLEALYKTRNGQFVSNIGTSALQTSAPIISEHGAGIVTDNGSGIISENGGGLVTDNGAGLVSEDGLGVISNDGNSIISNDGASFR